MSQGHFNVEVSGSSLLWDFSLHALLRKFGFDSEIVLGRTIEIYVCTIQAFRRLRLVKVIKVYVNCSRALHCTHPHLIFRFPPFFNSPHFVRCISWPMEARVCGCLHTFKLFWRLTIFDDSLIRFAKQQIIKNLHFPPTTSLLRISRDYS